MKKHSFSLAVVLAAGLVGGCVGAGVTHMGTAHAADQPIDQSVTVYVDATFGFRKDSFARKLSKSHAKYAERGYHFAGMQIYDENGDMQGAFVTYTRN
ncbi:MAG TPA: hypothetical protein VFK31_09920 [Rhodanobacteraceae bacterium]|nr:hypothetical protein [Rhodanobacteraceae bacterium]